MSTSTYITLLIAAKHALMSYASGNAAPDLGAGIAEKIDAALKGLPKGFGLTLAQEPKYSVCPVTGRIINRATGVAIPDDEPIMIFRAKDVKARPTVRRYVDLVNEDDPSSHHHNVCFERYQQFVTFAEEHPERMREPNTAPEVAG